VSALTYAVLAWDSLLVFVLRPDVNLPVSILELPRKPAGRPRMNVLALPNDKLFSTALFGCLAMQLASARRGPQISNANRLPHCFAQHQERTDKTILSVESGGPADVALLASALVRWLCVTGFSRVCPSIFLSTGSV
jgi:hypothetical protein